MTLIFPQGLWTSPLSDDNIPEAEMDTLKPDLSLSSDNMKNDTYSEPVFDNIKCVQDFKEDIPKESCLLNC